MLYSAEQILTEFEKILYQELTVIKKIANFSYSAIYYIEKRIYVILATTIYDYSLAFHCQTITVKKSRFLST